MNNPNLFGGKEWIEEVSDDAAYEGYISRWIAEAKIGNLTKEDVLKAAAKIADHRKDPSILSKAESLLGLL